MGVIDRPVRYDGRRAIYGYRHLLQLLCVKKLQQEGHPLQLIQRTLAGRSTAALERALRQTEGETSGTAIRPPGPSAVEGKPDPSAPRLVAAQVAPGGIIEQIRRFLSRHSLLA
jgi:hypothetical protein